MVLCTQTTLSSLIGTLQACELVAGLLPATMTLYGHKIFIFVVFMGQFHPRKLSPQTFYPSLLTNSAFEVFQALPVPADTEAVKKEAKRELEKEVAIIYIS